jgi:hypothetical protein
VVVIPGPQTPSPGRFSLRTREFAREWLDTFNVPGVTDCAAVTGSQVSKTTTLSVGLLWSVANAPCSCLVVMPNSDLARNYSETRLQPIIEATADLARLVPRGTDRHAYKVAQMQLGGAVISLVGSNSPSNLASRPVRLLLCDETDKFAPASERESDAISLAEQRTKAFANPQRWRTSTPTLPDGPIWQGFLAGDQRRYEVPCVHCDKFLLLAWSKDHTLFRLTGREAFVRWDSEASRQDGSWDMARVVRSARAECPYCGGHILDGHKTRMVRDGRWVPTVPGIASHRSWHLPSLYASSPETTFGRLAMKFLTAKASLVGLQGFITGELAEPWEDQTVAIRSRRADAVWLGSDPVPGGIRLMTVDVQALSPMFWVVIREWGESGESHLVFAGHCDQWEDLARIQLAHQVENHRVLVDSGFNGQEVYARCMGHAKVLPRANGNPLFVGWTPAKSREGRLVWIDKNGRKPAPYFFGRAALPPQMRVELPLVEWDAESVRDLLARLRDGKEGAPVWALVPFPAGVDVPGARRVDEDAYYLQLDSWGRKAFADARRGKVVMKWASRTQKAADHLLDCELLQVVAAMIHRRLKISTLQAENAGSVAAS